MAVWDELRQILARLLEEQPGTVARGPDPHQSEGGPPPYEIHLAPWAEATAGELNGRFGDQLDLIVGVLPYPPGRPPRHPPGCRPGEPVAPLDPREAEAELDGPAVVRSGHTLRHGLLLSNHTGAELAIVTNGAVNASVVDPGTGEEVGRYFGAQTLALVMFRVTPAGTERIPLLIGTASTTERLGYTVPPGTWGLQATLDFAVSHEERIRRRTPVLPLTVTA